MARVSFVEKGQGHPMVEDLYRKIETRRQRIINLFKVLGHCPYIGLNWQRLGNSLLTGEELPPRLREVAILRVGSLTGSEYEFTQHTSRGLSVGLSPEQIEAVHDWENSSLFDEQERAVLAYTNEVERGIKVKEETFNRLKSFLSEHAIVELTVVIGYYGMVSRFLIALDVELEE
ncbi:MAG: carboxymuconolactone decarboxylase family protein [Dehalococcoidales bacterium]|nr:MAG: carboxymuconolactone decarboxylase family protein [Dehalococcoidales bacterium]